MIYNEQARGLGVGCALVIGPNSGLGGGCALVIGPNSGLGGAWYSLGAGRGRFLQNVGIVDIVFCVVMTGRTA